MKKRQTISVGISIACSVMILLAGCSPALISTLAVTTPKIVQSADTRSKAQSLQKNTTVLPSNNEKYARYFIYRSGSLVGAALSCLIYDNNRYVGVANVRTFEKVEYVTPGDHSFTSESYANQSVKLHFDAGKTYIIKVYANTKVRPGTLVLMNQEMIKKEIDKGNFFSTKFKESGLKLEDISN